jgi:hypothetical protein
MIVAFLKSLFIQSLEGILSDITRKVEQLNNHADAKLSHAAKQDAKAAKADAAAYASRLVAARAANVAQKLSALVS